MNTKKQKQKQNKNEPRTTEIAFILDRSGSMGHVSEVAIAGFNGFLKSQKDAELEASGLARLSLILFDDRIEVPIDNIPLSEVVSLDARTYSPRGTTALLDAIGKTVKRFRKRIKALKKKDRPDKVIFAIFTDGLENASRKYTWQEIATLIGKRQKKDGWEFLFLGANQDAIATAAQMNIPATNAATASGGERGVSGSSRAFSRKIRAMRTSGGGHYDAAFPPQDLEKSMDDILREEEG